MSFCQPGDEFWEYARDPVEGRARYEQWLESAPRSEEGTKFKRALQYAAEIAETHVRNYLSEDPVTRMKVALRKRVHLDLLSRLLGRVPEHPSPLQQGPVAASEVRRVALLTQLDVPSVSFHFAVIRSVKRAMAQRNFPVTVHEVEEGDLAKSVQKVRALFAPNVFVMLRITPDREALEDPHRAGVPVLLIHAERQVYEAPVVAHIVPVHDRVEGTMVTWRKRLAERYGKDRLSVVVVSMPEEAAVGEFAAVSGQERSIRNARRAAVRDAVARCGDEVRFHEVADYSFHHARNVIRENGEADAFVCLSDQIAVALQHQLEAAGRDWMDRVVGFDDSKVAAEAGIPSIGQERDHIGRRAADELIRLQENGPDSWPSFREVEMSTELVDRTPH